MIAMPSLVEEIAAESSVAVANKEEKEEDIAAVCNAQD